MKSNLLREKYLTGDFLLRSEFQNDGDTGRADVLERCEKYAGWTLPYIFPNRDVQDGDEMQNDYQSVGAQATINLANKIVMVLFQPSKPFFRMQLTKEQRAQLQIDMSDAEVDAALAQTERDAMQEGTKLHARIEMNTIALLLIITGNALMYIPPEEGTISTYSIRDYTIKRDLSGSVIKMIIKETKSVSGLDDDLAALATSEGYHDNDEVSIYTGIMLVGENRFIVWQELEDVCYCHKKMGIYPRDKLPWIPLTWSLTRGKDLGTGLVEQYSGDFHSLSTLSEAILDYSTIVTDIKTLVDPAGQTDVREINQAASGSYVHGVEGDLHVHTADVSNASDFLEKSFARVERRIGAAFLLNNAVTRDAERVTAQEIRMQAQELEGSLGGVYSRLAVDLQLPLAGRLLTKLDKTFKNIEPIIVTGFESLSRNSDLDNLRAFIQDLAGIAEVPESLQARMKMGDVIAILGAGHGVEYDKFLKDEDTVQRENKQRLAEEAEAAGLEAGAVKSAEGQQQPVNT